MTNVTYNRNDLKELKKLYRIAANEGKEIVIYKGNEYLTSYLKYLIEYLETVFEPDGNYRSN